MPVLLLLLLLLRVGLAVAAASSGPPDAAALLALKSAVDVSGRLPWRHAGGVCGWYGVRQCSKNGRVTKLVLESVNLTGHLQPGFLSPLGELRVLSFKTNFLSGEVPDLSGLRNLKALFLDGNRFSGRIPPSLSSLRRLKVVSLSGNGFSGAIPISLSKLPRLRALFLQNNRLSGPIPAFDQGGLRLFNVSGNLLSGEIPRTRALRRFNASSFAVNGNLCGEQLRRPCKGLHSDPFLSPPEIVLSSSSSSSSSTGRDEKRKRRMPVIISSSVAGFLFLAAGVPLAAALAFSRKRTQTHVAEAEAEADNVAGGGGADGERVFSWEAEQLGKLTFCGGGAAGEKMYTLEELLKASAETLGRGTTGSTYKAVMQSGLTVAVKRLRDCSASSSSFRRRAEALGTLRHPNLVPLGAFFHAQRERLLVYDYLPNGSLLSLVQGGKPLHWTSCLKIAEDVAAGLAHLHEVAGEVHGNLKPSNVLLGPDFECCLVDYGLGGGGAAASTAADMFGFGLLLLELVTGKASGKEIAENDKEILQWARAAREEGSGSGREEEKLGTLAEVAAACVAARPEDRPTAGEALRMIRAARAAASSISGGSDQSPGRWSDAVQSLPRASNGLDHMNLPERD